MKEENLSIPEQLRRITSKFPDKTALQVKRNGTWFKLTYKQLEDKSLKVSSFLVREGLRKNDACAIILENRPEWAVIYLGIVAAGLTCVPLDTLLSPDEINNLIRDSEAKVIFCSRDIFANKIDKRLKEGSAKIVLLDMPECEGGNLVGFPNLEGVPVGNSVMPDIFEQDIASLIYTSGTTGQPKGVLLSHFNICSNAASILKLNFCSRSDNALSILPLHHTYAFMVTLIVPLFLGATVTYCFSLRLEELSRAIKEGGVTVLVGVPQLFSMLYKGISGRVKKFRFLPLFVLSLFIRSGIRRMLGASLRLLVSGGARLDPEVGEGLSGLLGIKLIEGYGLTETSPVVTLNPLKKVKFGSVGLPIPGVQIKILGPDSSGVGQVLIKGPNVMPGYFKHPEWTGAVIKEGWFYSGDLGYTDAEGYLFLVGREKDVIVLGSGKNIYPEELEEYYGKSPYIKEVCIMDVKEERFGRLTDTLHAIVVPNLEYFKEKNEANVHAKIRWELENFSSRLPSYNRVMGFLLTKEELPRTPLRKIKRYLVKERYFPEGAAGPALLKGRVFSGEGLGDLNIDISRKIIDYISVQINKPVYPDSHLEIDLGIDSLAKVELAMGLEGIFRIKFPDELFYGISTVKELIAAVSGMAGKAVPTLSKAERREKDWNQVLSEPASKEILQKIRVEPRFPDILATSVLRIVFTLLFRIFWFLRIEGGKNLSSSGPYLVCPNHASYLDGPVLFSSLPAGNLKEIYFLGFSDILEQPLIKWAIKPLRLIPFDPNTNLTGAMQAVSYLLSRGKIVCIFPEGRRSVDESVGEFKKGIGILIKELNVPVVPVYIKGSHKAWPRTNRFPRLYPLRVIFGRTLLAEELLGKKESGRDDYETVSANLREEVIKLA